MVQAELLLKWLKLLLLHHSVQPELLQAAEHVTPQHSSEGFDPCVSDEVAV